MKAAVLVELGAPPRFSDFADPVAGPGQSVVNVAAAGVHHVDLAKASGSFYTGSPTVPSVMGSDGVGRTADGRRVFFDTLVPPYGSWAQRALVPDAELLEPAVGVSDVIAAALGNTGLAAWLALSWSAKLQRGESVLVLGTGALGMIAVQAAKAQGAAYVIAADRDPGRLELARERGADVVVTIAPGADLSAAFREAAGEHGVDVIIDPLWGDPAFAAMQAASHGARYVQLGNSAASTVELPAATIRSRALHLLGFAVFYVPLEPRREAYRSLTEHAAGGSIIVDTIQLPLSEVASAWEQQRRGAHGKLVLIP